MPALHNDTRQHMHTHTHACVCASLLVMMYLHHHVRCGAGPRALTTTHAHGRTRRHACPRMSCKIRTCTCAHNACNDQLIESAEPLRLGAPTPLRCRNTCARLDALVGPGSRAETRTAWDGACQDKQLRTRRRLSPPVLAVRVCMDRLSPKSRPLTKSGKVSLSGGKAELPIDLLK